MLREPGGLRKSDANRVLQDAVRLSAGLGQKAVFIGSDVELVKLDRYRLAVPREKHRKRDSPTSGIEEEGRRGSRFKTSPTWLAGVLQRAPPPFRSILPKPVGIRRCPHPVLQLAHTQHGATWGSTTQQKQRSIENAYSACLQHLVTADAAKRSNMVAAVNTHVEHCYPHALLIGKTRKQKE